MSKNIEIYTSVKMAWHSWLDQKRVSEGMKELQDWNMELKWQIGGKGKKKENDHWRIDQNTYLYKQMSSS